jgi:uncharacterized membrane protein
MEKSFSVMEVLETSWEITKKNFVVILGYSLVAFMLLAIIQFTSMFLMSQNGVLSFVGLFLVLIINSMATLGFYKLTFHLIDKEEEDMDIKSVVPSWKNISSFITLTLMLGFIVATFNLIYQQLLTISSFHQFVEMMKASPVAVEVMAVVAFILIMLVAMRFMFFPCFIIDDDSSSFESLRQSRQLTQDNLLKIITVLLVVIGFIILGFLALGIGIIITYPFTNIILVVTYRKLVNAYVNDEEEQIPDNI